MHSVSTISCCGGSPHIRSPSYPNRSPLTFPLTKWKCHNLNEILDEYEYLVRIVVSRVSCPSYGTGLQSHIGQCCSSVLMLVFAGHSQSQSHGSGVVVVVFWSFIQMHNIYDLLLHTAAATISKAYSVILSNEHRARKPQIPHLCVCLFVCFVLFCESPSPISILHHICHTFVHRNLQNDVKKCVHCIQFNGRPTNGKQHSTASVQKPHHNNTPHPRGDYGTSRSVNDCADRVTNDMCDNLHFYNC